MTIASLSGLPLAGSMSVSTYLAIASFGAALGFAWAYYRCRTQHGACDPRIRINIWQRLRRRLVTLLWTVLGGVAAAISGHVAVAIGLAEYVLVALRTLVG